MHFSTAVLFSAVGLASASAGYGDYPVDETTVYETQATTIHSCAPDVPDCPGAPTGTTAVGESHSAPAETYPAETSSVVGEESHSAPVESYGEETSGVAVESSNSPDHPTSVPGQTGFSTLPISLAPDCTPTAVVKTITTDYTTVIPTTILVTEAVPCDEVPGEQATGTGVSSYPPGSTGLPGYSVPGEVPSGTGEVPGVNPSETPIFAGAAGLSGSAFLAAAAGVAAYILA